MEKYNNPLAEAQKVLIEEKIQIENNRINPLNFKGVKFFNDKEIDDDLLLVEEKKNTIQRSEEMLDESKLSIRKNSDLVETLLYTSLKDGKWLGDEGGLIIPSLYDDYFRGVDSIVQFLNDPNNPRYLGLSIDFSMSDGQISQKMAPLLERISKGNTESVKYFDSPSTGKLKNLKMPKIILGADYAKIKKLADTVVEGHLMNKPVANLLENDPLQYILLEEIRTQLVSYKNISKYFGNQDAERVHSQSLDAFMEILSKRKINMEKLKTHSRGDLFSTKLHSFISKFDK